LAKADPVLFSNTKMPPPVSEKTIGVVPLMGVASPPVANNACGSIGVRSANADDANPSERMKLTATDWMAGLQEIVRGKLSLSFVQ